MQTPWLLKQNEMRDKISIFRSQRIDFEKESLRSGRSDRRRHSHQYDRSTRQKTSPSTGDYTQETSTSRIVRSYVPTAKSNFYPRFALKITVDLPS